MEREADAAVAGFLDSVQDPRRRREGQELAALMERVTGWTPVMWGASIVGFGDLHYRYESGREGDTFVVGFSPRKSALTLYGLLSDADDAALEALGPHTRGKGCLYVKDLARIDTDVLEALVTDARTRAT